MNLPQAFIDSMKARFDTHDPASWDLFLQAFDGEAVGSWRHDPTKTDKTFLAQSFCRDFPELPYGPEDYLKPVPWAADAYYIPPNFRPGLSTAHRLGLIYIQEASAMVPARLLQAKPGDRVIDLCAAPGGKSLQLASAMQGEGILVSNDISRSRARILQRNFEQQGLAWAYITSFDPVKGIPQAWEGFFDKVQLDAPCSGEGMFRRDPKAVRSWSNYGPKSIRPVQENLLEVAASLLRVGGCLVYSTCTFNTYENEELITEFLSMHPEFTAEKEETLEKCNGLRSGLEGEGILPEVSRAALRVWPQDGKGEGQSQIRLRKVANGPVAKAYLACFSSTGKNKMKKARQAEGPTLSEATLAIRNFAMEHMTKEASDVFTSLMDVGKLSLSGKYAFLEKEALPGLDCLKPLKTGLFLGELKQQKKDKSYTLVPSHAWLLAMPGNIWKAGLNLGQTDSQTRAVFKGGTLVLEEDEGDKIAPGAYVPILCEGYPLAWGKRQGSTVKNLFPPSWVD